MLSGPDELRFALQQLRLRNAQHEFEQLCLALARTTIAPNFLFPTGPVSSGGDRGRDFDSFPSFSAALRELGIEYGYRPGDLAVGICTLQQENVRHKILSDARKLKTKGLDIATVPKLVFAYCEADVSIGRRLDVENDAKSECGFDLKVFDGTAIADLLWRHRHDLADDIDKHLGVTPGARRIDVPRRLPRSPQNFVNRADELDEMDRVLESAASRPTSSVIVLEGLRGVGKSAIAAHWSNSVRGQFPDGDLYLDFARSADPLVPDIGDLLGELLRDLGVPGDAIPGSFEDRSRLFEQETASRRLLMFIDNAQNPAPVRAALPTGSGSVVVVASNNEMAELVCDGARRIEVAPVSGEAGRQLVQELAGRPLGGESQELDRLVEHCEGLPIALAACGSLLATRSYLGIGELVSEIEKAMDRLLTVSGRAGKPVAAVFETAYGALGNELANFYRHIGQHQGAVVGVGAAGALAGIEPERAHGHLQALRRAQLLTEVSPERYEIHGLIQTHMRQMGLRDEPVPRLEAAVERVIGWYCQMCRSADRAVQRDRLRLTTNTSESPAGGELLSGPGDAYLWFQRERHNVLAAITAAEERQMHEHVWQFAEALWPLCATQKWFRAWEDSQQAGVRSAVSLGDSAVEARVRSQLARAYAELGKHPMARVEIEAAKSAVQRTTHEALAASVREFEGVCAMAAGDYRLAEEALADSRERMARVGSVRGAALSDYYLAKARLDSGNPAGSLDLLSRTGPAFARLGDSVNAARVEIRRGEAFSATGQPEAAIDVLMDVLPALEALGLRFELAEAYEALAKALTAAEKDADALLYRRRAYQQYSLVHHPRAEVLEIRLTGGV